ncbi:MAG: TldD/PmbA family protein [candidate division Zixibacteria bacterium]
MKEITRRSFLKAGAGGVVIASIPGIFRLNPLAAFASPAAGKGSLADYYEHFGVDEAVIRQVMAAALEKGGDYCDIFFQHSISSWIGLEDNVVDRAYTNVDFGVGIRVIEGEQTGYSFTEEISLESMKLAAKTAANIADQSKTIPPQAFKFHDTPDYYPIETLWEDVKIDRKIPYLQKINDRVFAGDSRVIKSKVWFNDESSYILIANSEGKIVCDYQPQTRVSASCTAEQNGKRENNGFNLAGRQGIEFFTPDRVNRIGDEAVRRTITLFDAVKPEAGEMEVVLAAGSSGILLHEAIGHGMEADFNRKNISIFADKINKPVAESFVSIVDDGTNPNIRGSLNVDDEGNDSEVTYLVENGILRSYLHDRISAQHYKVKPTGNGRRQSFRHIPMPRMRNTYMLPGPHGKEEIIKTVKKGLYAESFTNGQVFIGAGDFTFYVKSGFLIEDGKLTKPVKDVNIIGNGPNVLKNIVMVGDDPKLAEGGWTCGKNGQRVPVSQGLPTVKVSSITVGGISS